MKTKKESYLLINGYLITNKGAYAIDSKEFKEIKKQLKDC